MSFEHLASNWADHPLTDPEVTADAIDLMVSLGDRRRGTFTVLICDPDDRYRATVVIELPPDCLPTAHNPRPGWTPAQLCEKAMHPIIPAVHTAPGTSLVLALGRPGPRHLPDLDTQWASAAATICRAAGVRLLGFYVASKDGIYRPDEFVSTAA
ncbi:hypothetical protein [Kribbella sp. NPDC048915]|uniref:hypothetical protein n=1 Tax=Kribbella sp. NPDC048915 TaxID=3155148 RepID=UPI003406BD7D